MRILLAALGLVLGAASSAALAGDFTDPLFRTGVENSTCPNNVVEDSEQCDDGNAVTGDACAANCRLYNCGDGQFDSPFEECDDGGTVDGDGCEGRFCSIEPGFQCTGAPSICFGICGDGIIVGGEGCDDGNSASGDGCSAACGVEPGFQCTGQPSVCIVQVLAEIEPNEDGSPSTGGSGIAGNDYASANAIANGAFDAAAGGRLVGAALLPAGDEDVFLLTNTTGQQQVARMDTWNGNAGFGVGMPCAQSIDTGLNFRDAGGAVQASNDDRNGAADRCSSLAGIIDPGAQRFAHVVEFGDDAAIPSYLLQLQFRPVVCGDNLREGNEECDDGNVAAGDGCSATCQIEAIVEIEPNNTVPEATASPVQVLDDAYLRAAIAPVGDPDVYRALVVPTRRTLRLETFQPLPNQCGVTTTLRLLDQFGVEFANDSVTGIGGCSAIVIDLVPGFYFVRVEEAGNNAAIAGYFLELDYVADAGVETEPNETIALATPELDGQSSAAVLGDHSLNADVDVYRVTVPPGKGLRAEVIEGDRSIETCESNGIDSRLRLLNASGLQLLEDDDGGRGFCSSIDGTGPVPLDAAARNGTASPQTWYLVLEQSGFASGAAGQFSYRLQVTIR